MLAAGPFTDIFLAAHQVTVEGAFDHVVTMLSGGPKPEEEQRDLLKRA